MVELAVNGIEVEIDEGATVLEAAAAASVEVPTLCHMKDAEPQTSCMICVVKNTVSGQLIPACSAKVSDGMQIDTECDEVQAARRNILNLLLSEHVGDCEAPCTRICPAHLDIPHMLREIERGNLNEAGWIARRDLAIPHVLSHVCPAPCEKGCRRGQLDTTISIRSLHGGPFLQHEGRPITTERTVAVIGSGAAGLACAWQLHLLGCRAVVFDEQPKAGGSLRTMEQLPDSVLDAEIEALQSAGIIFRLGEAFSISAIASEFDGVVNEIEEHRLVVKTVANGKAAARELVERLQGSADQKTAVFDSRIGRLRDSELEQLAGNCSADVSSYTDLQREAARCLHCDCRNPVSCKLRRYAAQYGAKATEYPADERSHVQLLGSDENIVLEPGKCIRCGLCIEITRREGEPLGLSFTERGIHTQVKVPFGEVLEAGLQHAGKACVEICPTGALAFRDAEER